MTSLERLVCRYYGKFRVRDFIVHECIEWCRLNARVTEDTGHETLDVDG